MRLQVQTARALQAACLRQTEATPRRRVASVKESNWLSQIVELSVYILCKTWNEPAALDCLHASDCGTSENAKSLPRLCSMDSTAVRRVESQVLAGLNLRVTLKSLKILTCKRKSAVSGNWT